MPKASLGPICFPHVGKTIANFTVSRVLDNLLPTFQVQVV